MFNRVPGTLFDLIRLRGGPQDLPAGWLLTAITLVLVLIPGLISSRILDEPDGLPRSLVAIGIQALVAGLLLQFRGMGARIPQTLSALCGTGFMFGLMIVVLLLGLKPEGPSLMQVLIYWTVFFWSLTVDASIYRHALSIRIQTGALVAVLVFAGNFILLRALFG